MPRALRRFYHDGTGLPDTKVQFTRAWKLQSLSESDQIFYYFNSDIDLLFLIEQYISKLLLFKQMTHYMLQNLNILKDCAKSRVQNPQQRHRPRPTRQDFGNNGWPNMDWDGGEDCRFKDHELSAIYDMDAAMVFGITTLHDAHDVFVGSNILIRI